MSENFELYQKLNKVAKHKKSWENELQSGCLLLGVAKEKGMNYEQCFDSMLTHYESAYNLACDEESKLIVLEVSSKFIASNILAIESVLEEKYDERKKLSKDSSTVFTNIIKKMANNIKESKDSILSVLSNANKSDFSVEKALTKSNAGLQGISKTIDLLPDIAEAGSLLIANELEGKLIKDMEWKCYGMLTNIFIKIIASRYIPLTQSEELVRVFGRNKENILRHCIYNGTVKEASHLVSLEQNSPIYMYSSARIVLEALCENEKWREAKKFLKDKSVKRMFEKKDIDDLWSIYEREKINKDKDSYSDTFLDRVKDFAEDLTSFLVKVLLSIILSITTAIVYITYKFSTSGIRSDSIVEKSLNFIGTLGHSLIFGILILIFSVFLYYYAIKYIPAFFMALITKGEVSVERSPVVTLILFLSTISLMIGTFVFAYKIYDPKAIEETNRITTAEAEVDNLINNKKYSETYKSISEKLVWMIYMPIISKSDTTKVKEIQKEKYRTLINTMLDDFNERNGKWMNRKNYNYIYNQIIPLYENTVSKLDRNEQKEFDRIMISLLEQLDISRHRYLEELMGQIKTMDKNNAKIKEMLTDIYHNSDRKYRTKAFVLVTSYKGYWEKQKKDFFK